MKTIISTPKAPAAIGPYSQAVLVNGMLFTSGVIPIDPRQIHWLREMSLYRQDRRSAISRIS